MVVPVIAGVEGHRDQRHPIPPGGGHQAAPRFLGESGFHADSVRVQRKQLVVVGHLHRAGRIAEMHSLPLGGADSRQFFVFQYFCRQQRHIVSARGMSFRVQPGRSDKVAVLHPDFLRAGIHLLRK